MFLFSTLLKKIFLTHRMFVINWTVFELIFVGKIDLQDLFFVYDILQQSRVSRRLIVWNEVTRWKVLSKGNRFFCLPNSVDDDSSISSGELSDAIGETSVDDLDSGNFFFCMIYFFLIFPVRINTNILRGQNSLYYRIITYLKFWYD